MKIMKNKLLALIVISAVLLTCYIPTGYAAFGLPDGGVNARGDTGRTLNLLDFDDALAISNAGFTSDRQHLKDGKYSAYWNHNAATQADIKSAPTDWSEYYELNLSMYTKNGAGTKFEIVAVCQTGYFHTQIEAVEGQHDYSISFGKMLSQPGADWSKIQYIRFSSSGWGNTPSLDAEYWINGFNIKTVEDGIERMYPTADVKAVYDAMEGNVAVYAGGKQVLSGKDVVPYSNIEWINDSTSVPIDIFSEYLGADVNNNDGKITVKANKKTVSFTVGDSSYTSAPSGTFVFAPYEKSGEIYVPGSQIAELLEYETKVDKKLLIIGDEKVRSFDSYSKVSNMIEIAGYLTYYENVDPATVTLEEMKLAKDRWRYYLVGDEDIDLTDSAIADIAKQVGNRGKGSWEEMKASALYNSLEVGTVPGDTADGPNKTSFFFDRDVSASSDMTAEYTRINNMALAWAQKGSELYHNPELLADIIFALDFMEKNRYGQDEIENDPSKAWRDHTITNWYDWQIDSPRLLVDTLMLIEEELTTEQIGRYLAFFDYWLYTRCYNSMKVDAGMNVLYTDKNWMGSMLLQNKAEGLLDAVSCLHNCFAWGDNFVTNEGYFSDGSYVFHGGHPMTGQYGITQFEQSGPILSFIKGTSFDFKNPRRENIFDWIYDAYEPIIYDGGIFRFVKGRAVTSNDHYVGRQFIKGCLNLLEFADSENEARMKSLIKYYVNNDKVASYADTSLSVAQRAQLKAILDDPTIQEREPYYISKTYYNMDKVVHQRKDWAFGISMSSTRIYDYECIHGENPVGWYTSDGMTQLMLGNDQKQFSTGYWNEGAVDPYKYPGITADTQERDKHTINTGNAFYKDFDFVGGATYNGEYSTAAQMLNAFHLDEDIDQGDGNIIKAHDSSLVAKKSWFMFDDEVVCLGAGINANDGFDVRTIVENRKSNKTISLIPEDQVTPQHEIVSVYASATPQAENSADKSIDGDYASKWASESGASITYDIGSVKEIGMVGFAFMSGNKRTQAIDIELSEDGENWINMFSGNTGGKTEALEIFDMKNTPARYVKLTHYGNSAGGAWISLSEAVVYGPYEGTEPQVVEGIWIGSEKVIVNGVEESVTESELTRNDIDWVNLETVGGYYFPDNGSVTMSRKSGISSFFEMWLNHGLNPAERGYSYVILPTMTADETSAYASNPDIEILSNTAQISAVKDKSTGMTGVVFWEAGTFDGITVDEPMIIMYKRAEDVLSIVASDPTHKLNSATIKTDDYVSLENSDYRMELLEDGKGIEVIFDSSNGESISGNMREASGPPPKKDEASTGSNTSNSGGGGGGNKKPVEENPEDGKVNESTGSKPAISFNDLAGFDWAKEFIETLTAKGIISGRGDGTFAPGDNVNRAEYVKMMVLAVGLELGEYDGFGDVNKNDWFYPYVSAAFNSGAVSGKGNGIFGALDDIKRQDAAVIIYRLLDAKDGKKTADFKDFDEIDSYAKEAVSYLAEIGVFSGDENGNFMPKKPLTRAEAAKIICLILEIVN